MNRVVVAIGDQVVRAWARYALRAAAVCTADVADVAALFDALAAGPALLVLGARFDRRPAAALLATIRTAGCRVPVIVLGARPSRAITRLGATELLGVPLDSRALMRSVASWLAPPRRDVEQVAAAF